LPAATGLQGQRNRATRRSLPPVQRCLASSARSAKSTQLALPRDSWPDIAPATTNRLRVGRDNVRFISVEDISISPDEVERTIRNAISALSQGEFPASASGYGRFRQARSSRDGFPRKPVVCLRANPRHFSLHVLSHQYQEYQVPSSSKRRHRDNPVACPLPPVRSCGPAGRSRVRRCGVCATVTHPLSENAPYEGAHLNSLFSMLH
jgi:hypothetical protein